MSNQEKIAPCPFCGCATPVEGKLNPVKLKWRFIACPKCGARTRSSCDNARVIAAWNRRAPSEREKAVIIREMAGKLLALADASDGDKAKALVFAADLFNREAAALGDA